MNQKVQYKQTFRITKETSTLAYDYFFLKIRGLIQYKDVILPV